MSGVSRADRIAGLVEPIPFVPRGEVLPFDRERCRARMAALGKAASPTWWIASRLRWDRLDLTTAMTTEEAWFWLHVWQYDAPVEVLLEKVPVIRTTPYDVGFRGETLPPALVPAGFVALGLEKYCDRLFGLRDPNAEAVGVVERLIPILDAAERESLRSALHARATQPVPWTTWLLAALGQDCESISACVAAFPPSTASAGNGPNTALRAVFGLRSPERVLAEVERLHLLPWCAADARAMFAAAGPAAGAIVTRAIREAPTTSDAGALAGALSVAQGPEVVPHVFGLLHESRVAGVARKWLDANAEHAVPVLLPLAIGASDRANTALSYLRDVVRAGHEGLLTAALPELPDAAQQRVRARVFEGRVNDLVVCADKELPAWARSCFLETAQPVHAPGELPVPEECPPTSMEVGAVPRPSAPSPPEYVAPGTAAPFDFEACVARLMTCYSFDQSWGSAGHEWDWDRLTPPLPMTLEEGRFWIAASRYTGPHASPKEVEEKLREEDFSKPPRPTSLPDPHLLLPAIWAAGGNALLYEQVKNDSDMETRVAQVTRRVVVHLSPGERDDLRLFLLQNEVGLLLAQHLGATDAEMRAALRLVRPWTLAVYPRGYVLRLLAAYETPETVVREARRLGALPVEETTARWWLAATGWLGLDLLYEQISGASQEDGVGMAKVLASVRAPQVAPMMLRLHRGRTRQLAGDWLRSNIAHTIEGLLPLVGTKDELAKGATEHLQGLCRCGYRWLVEKKAGGRADVHKLVLAPRVARAKPTAADVALAARVAPLVIKTESGLRTLGPARTAALFAEVRSSSLGAPTARLTLVRDNVDEHARDTFAWSLFQSWLDDGAPSKERWRMEAVGHLGGDGSALNLAPLVQAWPGEGQHPRAVLGLECLSAIGSDTALSQIHGISRKISFKAIRQRAGECIERLAQARGLSPDELADRIISDGGLDEHGARTFDFGPRRFEFILGDKLEPMLRDEAGNRLRTLPAPTITDDAYAAAEAQDSWKVLKKQVADVVKTQARRLEHAMFFGRRWTPAEFEALFVRHSLMVHLVRRTLWIAYDAQGAPLTSFRVADDCSFADKADETVALPEGATAIGVAHPAHLGPNDVIAWGDVLADHHIVSPFPQLGRPIFSIEPGELSATRIHRFDNLVFDPGILVLGLDSLGWRRGARQEGGRFCSHRKTYGPVTAIVSYADGCWDGNPEDWLPQTITGVGFVPATHPEDDPFFSWNPQQEGLVLASVDVALVSEVLYDLNRLVTKGSAGQR